MVEKEDRARAERKRGIEVLGRGTMIGYGRDDCKGGRRVTAGQVWVW